MRNMMYGANVNSEILANGNYNGYNFYVVNYGAYPGAYVFLPRNDKYYQQSKNNIPITTRPINTTGISIRGISDSGWYISWQYRGSNDYYMLTFNDVHGGIKHTTESMIADCKAVIDELIKLNND